MFTLYPADRPGRAPGPVCSASSGVLAMGRRRASDRSPRLRSWSRVIGPRPAFVAGGCRSPAYVDAAHVGGGWVEIDRSICGHLPTELAAHRGGADVRAAAAGCEGAHGWVSLPFRWPLLPSEVLITAGDPGDRFYIVDQRASSRSPLKVLCMYAGAREETTSGRSRCCGTSTDGDRPSDLGVGAVRARSRRLPGCPYTIPPFARPAKRWARSAAGRHRYSLSSAAYSS